MKKILLLALILLHPSAHAAGIADLGGVYRGKTADCTVDIEVKEVVNLRRETFVNISVKDSKGTADHIVSLPKLNALYRAMLLRRESTLELKSGQGPHLGSHDEGVLRLSFKDGRLAGAYVQQHFILAGQVYGGEATCADLVKQ